MNPSFLSCPQCKIKYKGSIFLCEAGHGLCELCKQFTTSCPKCTLKMTNRRAIDLEVLVKEVQLFNLKLACEFKGCTYKLTGEQYDSHKMECKFRIHQCQASIFSGTDCDWSGNYNELLNHYQDTHPMNSALASTNVKDFSLAFTFEDYKDIQVLSHLGKQLFYYKCKVDAMKEKAYFVFQFIGTKKEARDYTYEFELNKGFRKFKVTGFCCSDVQDINTIIEQEDCVCLTFQHLRHYLDKKNETKGRFRICNIKSIASPSNEPGTSN